MNASRQAQEAEREARAKVFKALADARRLEILEVLATSGPLSGTELAERVGISVALLSHHCKILADAGFLDRRQQGQCKYCSLDFVRLREATECWLTPMPLATGVHAPPVLPASSAHSLRRDETPAPVKASKTSPKASGKASAKASDRAPAKATARTARATASARASQPRTSRA